MIEELGDRAGKGTSPDDAVERLAVLHAKEADPALREEILDALAWIASGAAFDSILGMLRDATDDEQRAAAGLELVISDLANAGDWERVARGLEADLPTALRVTTVETLMMEGDAAAVARLPKLLGEPDAEVREAAVLAVEALAEPR
jgi:HEAT repeat protein